VEPLRIGIAGGSIGGLTAGVVLHEQGHDVHVFERSTSQLEDRGAGIVMLPMTEKYFVEKGAGLDGSDGREVALQLTNWSYIDRDGTIIAADATNNRFSSWNTVYRALIESFPSERYHLAHNARGYAARGGHLELQFAEQRPHRCDLIIAADGISSTIRSIVEPRTQPEYAGYVAWRGTIAERDLEDSTVDVFADSMVYQVLDHSHILVYAIPGFDGDRTPGKRLLNFVWYRNVERSHLENLMTDRRGAERASTMPPGMVRQHHLDEFRESAHAQLAPPVREVVLACSDPFIQVIFDMMMGRFVHGRVAVLGDAACVARPHVAAGTAKACADGWAMARHFAARNDLDEALVAWEREQLALANKVAARSRAMGNSAQVEGTMVPGDPDWRFGLFGPGN
jgi:2,6-dihydroxypyridine 3-monooxygenase